MRILALETAGIAGSLAALEDDRVVGERQLGTDARTARALAPAMRDLLSEVGWRPRDVELTAVAVGPGSFTGLRIGITTAKTFAYAAGTQVLGVNTLEAIAERCPRSARSIAVVLDALRNQLFAARFSRDGSDLLIEEQSTHLVDVDRWLNDLPAAAIITGSGLEKLVDRLPPSVTAIDRNLWSPNAAAVGQLAYRHFLTGRRDDVFKLIPCYYRRTAAQEQWESKQRP